MQLSLCDISFQYEGAQDDLFTDLTAVVPAGWTGIVGPNGAGKTTLLRLACGELRPKQGTIHIPGRVVYCPQRTDDPPALLPDLLAGEDKLSRVLRHELLVGDDWADRWDTLSHGERKRAQIAVALWQEPQVLAIDEPTNHIDADARRLLMQALQRFQGVGLIVSHDRELLDALSERCIFVDPPNATMRPGNYTSAREQADAEEARLRSEYAVAKREAQRLADEAARRAQEADRAAAMASKRRTSRKDHDAREKIDMARFFGTDGKAGRLRSQLDGRLQQAESRLSEFNIKRRYETHLWMPGSRSHRNVLFTIPEGFLDLGAGRRLCFPELSMQPDARVAVTGPNGAGKSTLIRHILASLDLEPDRVIYMPQEIGIEEARRVMHEVNAVPNDQLGRIMTIVSCLGTRPARLVGGTDASPGEIRKILLALGMSRAPHLIIMDEPTNHLDLPAIESLEDALADCPCGLLLVSHDMRFLSRVARTAWHISEDPSACRDMRLTIRDMG